MAEDTEEEAEERAVELGDGPAVEGAPLARVSSRLTWGLERSEVRRREGDTEIRTPEGPRTVGDLLDEVNVPYFESRNEFERAVRDVTGVGPVATSEDE